MMMALRLFTQSILALLSLLFFVFSAQAVEEIPRHYRSTRSAGMGGVTYTTGHYADALFGNPARHGEVDTWKISILDLTLETNDNLLQSYKDFSKLGNSSGSSVISSASKFIGNNQHFRIQALIGFFHPHLIGDLGFGIGIFAATHANLLIHYTTDVYAQLIGDIGPALGFSYPFFNKRLSLGANVRGLYRVGTDQGLSALDFLSSGQKISLASLGNQGIGADGDVGAYYRLPWEPSFMRIALAATITNVAQSPYNLATKKFIQKLGTKMPRNDRLYHGGLRFDFPDVWYITAPLIAIEYQDFLATNKRMSWGKSLHLGTEFKFFRRIFSLRGGVYQGYLAGGFGVDLPILKLDFATYGEELTGNSGVMEDRRFIARIGVEI